MATDDWMQDLAQEMVSEHLRGVSGPSASRPSPSLSGIASSARAVVVAGGHPAAPHPHNHAVAAKPELQRMFASAVSARSKRSPTQGSGEKSDGEKPHGEKADGQTLKDQVQSELKIASAKGAAMKKPACVANPKGKSKGKGKAKSAASKSSPKAKSNKSTPSKAEPAPSKAEPAPSKAEPAPSKPEPEDVNGDSDEDDDDEGAAHDTSQKDEAEGDKASPKASPGKTSDKGSVASAKDSTKGKAKSKGAAKPKAVADPSKSIRDQRNKFIAAKKKEFEDDGGNLTKQEAHAKACELWHESEEKKALLVGMSESEKRKRKFIR